MDTVPAGLPASLPTTLTRKTENFGGALPKFPAHNLIFLMEYGKGRKTGKRGYGGTAAFAGVPERDFLTTLAAVFPDILRMNGGKRPAF